MKVERKSILLLIPELGNGGAERSLIMLANDLAEHHSVTICVFSKADSHYPVNVVVEELDSPRRKSKLVNWYYRWKNLKRLKKKLKVQISISFLEGANYLNILSRAGDRVIVSIRGTKKFDRQIDGLSGAIRKNLLIPFLFPRSDKIVTVSSDLQREMSSEFGINPKKLIVIPNYYQVDKISAKAQMPLPENLKEIFQHKVLIYSARFHPGKDHIGLLHVFKQISLEQDCKLVLLGDGEMKQEIIGTSRSLGLTIDDLSDSPKAFPDPTRQIFLLGLQTNPFYLLKNSSLYISTSAWEGFPNAIAEALICGLQVISTDCPTGPKEILGFNEAVNNAPLRNKYGSLMPLVDASNSENLEAWKRECLYSLRIGEESPQINSLENVDNRFSKEEVFPKWIRLINSVYA